MPFGGGAPEFGDLPFGLLNLIFAERNSPGSDRFAENVGRVSLAYGYDLHFARIAARSVRGGFHPLADGPHIVCNSAHSA